MHHHISRGFMFTRIPSLIQTVLQTLVGEWDDEESCATLLALATTCRAFSDPSLDLIWSVLPSLRPLIQLFAPDLMKDTNYLMAEEGEIEAMIPPTPAQWVVIKRYSHRVRVLEVMQDTHSLRILKCIGSPTFPLLPNLTELWWFPHSDGRGAFIPLIYPLLTPELTELRMGLPSENDTMLEVFLEDYPRRCPKLQIVGLEFPEDEVVPEKMIEQVSRALINHENLQCLRCDDIPVNTAALKHLSMLPKLKLLSLEYYPKKAEQPILFLPEDTPLRNVEQLTLRTSDLDIVTSLLRPQDQMFHTLDLYLNNRPTADAVLTFFSTLGSCTFPLLKLSFAYFGSKQPLADEAGLYCISYDMILASLPCLRDLYIHWERPISLNDDELAELARHWPQLVSLTLHSGDGRLDHPLVPAKYITLNGLLMLVTLCPNLSSISFTVDAREVPADIVLQEPELCGSTVLKNLILSPGSPISHPYSVGRFLSQHFPSVERVTDIHSQDIVADYNQILWTEVDRFLGCTPIMRDYLQSFEDFGESTSARSNVWQVLNPTFMNIAESLMVASLSEVDGSTVTLIDSLD